MSVRRVALIYDDRNRPETTGIYCRRALGTLVDVVHFSPGALGTIPRRGFDLYLNIDDGLEYKLPDDLRPGAWWAIDTHLNFPWCLDKARGFDLVFAAQRDGAYALEAQGIANCRWLPLACDPDVHRKFEVAKVRDVAFVGNLFPGPRTELLERLQRRFPDTYVGRAYFEEMARVYSESRIVFNRSIKNDVNMRVFEALACGSLLLTNELPQNGQGDLFRDGVHLATYADAEEMLDKAAYYLGHGPARERIAAAGREEVVARHTYRHRMEELLQQVRRAVPSPSATLAVGLEVRPPPDSKASPPGEGGAASGDSPPDDGYYEFSRPEILALIPRSARKVLEVGCGAGRLGESLKARQPAEVVGIELSESAAARAARRLDRVIVGDVERLEPDFARGSFDCVICGDVLEHLRAPGSFLERARTWLLPGGVLVASLPNVRHHSVVTSLLAGDWTYESAGLLDETHLGFFTRRDVLALFEQGRYRVVQLGFVPGPGYEDWHARGRPPEVRAGTLHIADMTAEDAEEFYVYQHLVVARPEPEGLGHRAEERNDRMVGPSASRHAPAAPDAGVKAVARRNGRPMRFTQDFTRDFDQVDFWGRPFAFARFGDGERAICRCAPVVCRDGWAYDGRSSRFSAELNDALACDAPDYYVGISDGCCDREARDWFLERVRVPRERLTFANLFVNGNYRRFRQLDLSGLVVVASQGGDLRVPEDIINSDFDLDGLVARLLEVDRPMLVAAGPAACVIVHKYWTRADPETRQTIVDVGSAIDEVTKACRSRMYQHPGSPTADRICRW